MIQALKRKCLYLCPLSSSLLFVLSVPDFGLWFLAFFAYLPLFWAVEEVNSKTYAFLMGWLCGILTQMGIFFWIVHTAVMMSEFPLWLAILVLVAYSVFMGLGVGVTGMISYIFLKEPFSLLSVPCLVSTIDYVFPYLFPWTLAATFYRIPVLMQGIDLTGILGGTFICVMASVALAKMIRTWIKQKRLLISYPLIVVGILGLWILYGLFRLWQIENKGFEGFITLAIVQPDITAEEKKHHDAQSRKALYKRLETLTESKDLTQVDAVIWPEGAFPFYFAPDTHGRKGWENIEETSKRLVSFVKRIKKTLIFGTLTKPDGKARNTVVMLGEDGQEINRYDKRRLLAFGEYMPLSDTFPFLKNKIKEVSDMEPGNTPKGFVIKEVTATISICYEAVFPGFTRDAVNQTHGQMIINFTNDAWFGDLGAPRQHLMVQVPRAVELRVPLVRVTETGITAVILPTGEFIHETNLHEKRIDIIRVPIYKIGSLYKEIGDWFAYGCVFTTIISLLLIVLKKKKMVNIVDFQRF